MATSCGHRSTWSNQMLKVSLDSSVGIEPWSGRPGDERHEFLTFDIVSSLVLVDTGVVVDVADPSAVIVLATYGNSAAPSVRKRSAADFVFWEVLVLHFSFLSLS